LFSIYDAGTIAVTDFCVSSFVEIKF